MGRKRVIEGSSTPTYFVLASTAKGWRVKAAVYAREEVVVAAQAVVDGGVSLSDVVVAGDIGGLEEKTVLAWAKGRKKYTRKATGGAPGRHRRGPEQLELPLHGDTTRPVDEVAEVPCRVDNMP